MTLPKFHLTLQIAMGWKNYHLHQFIADGQCFGLPDPEFLPEMQNEARVPVSKLLPVEGASAVYEYDSGDDWQHTLTLERIHPYQEGEPLPRCIQGSRACPPEDCGGIHGYAHLLEALLDPKHPEHEELTRWAGDFEPERFDLSSVNFELGRQFGRGRA